LLGERYDEHGLAIAIQSLFRYSSNVQTATFTNAALDALDYENIGVHVQYQRGESYVLEIAVTKAALNDGAADGGNDHAGAGFVSISLEVGFKANRTKIQQAAMR
jgi:hypothetical protein